MIMVQRLIILCTAAVVASLLSTTAGAVEAVRTEAVEEYVEKNRPASGSVTTKTFTKAIVDGKPADDQKAFENTVDTVYFYTVLEGLKGQAVTHRWKYAGRDIANAEISVTDDPFPTWSSNKIEPNWTGFWTVEVLDSNSKVIGVGTFAYNHPRNLQMDPDANRAGGEDVGDISGGRWGRGRGWGW
jgi:hypothetical protein